MNRGDGNSTDVNGRKPRESAAPAAGDENMRASEMGRNDVQPAGRKGRIPERRFFYLLSAGINMLIFILLKMLPGFDVPVLTGDLPAVLPALELATMAQVTGNLILSFYRPPVLYYLFQIVLSALAARALYIVNKVFPFSFPDDLGFPLVAFLHAVFVFLMILTGLGLVAHLRSSFNSVRKRL